MNNMLYVAHHAEPTITLHSRQNITHVQVGKTLSGKTFDQLPITDADHSDNISDKNNLYSELTLQYDIWKNSKANFVGLAHYRRHFNPYGVHKLMSDEIIKDFSYEYGKDSRPSTEFTQEIFDHIVSDEVVNLLQQDARTHGAIITLTPFKKTNTYSLFTLADIGWLPVRTVIEFFEYCRLVMKPHDYATFTKVINEQNSHYCNNMIYCRKQYFDKYSEWLFNLLFGFEKHLRSIETSTGRSLIVPRMFGYFSEYMLKPWCEINHMNMKHVESICFENLKKDTRI